VAFCQRGQQNDGIVGNFRERKVRFPLEALVTEQKIFSRLSLGIVAARPSHGFVEHHEDAAERAAGRSNLSPFGCGKSLGGLDHHLIRLANEVVGVGKLLVRSTLEPVSRRTERPHRLRTAFW
jgi:hypothetical protein